MRKMATEELTVLKPQVRCLREEEQKVCVNNAFSCGSDARERKLVCVTSGNSNLGSHIVKALLARGYLVRVTIQNQGTWL